MAKKFWKWINELVILLSTFAVGGLFVSGTTLGFVILSIIPEIIHTIAGWGIMILAVVNFIKKIL